MSEIIEVVKREIVVIDSPAGGEQIVVESAPGIEIAETAEQGPPGPPGPPGGDSYDQDIVLIYNIAKL